MALPAAPGRRLGAAVSLFLLVGAALALVAVLVAGAGDRTSQDHRYVIPLGTAERIAAGEAVEILPERVEMHAGDTLTLVNEDDALQQTGFLAVRPHETLTYRFTKPGTYVSSCTLHPGGSVALVVLA